MQCTPNNIRAIFEGRKTQTRRLKMPHNLKRHLAKHWWVHHDNYSQQAVNVSMAQANTILAEHPYSECVCPGRGKPAAMWKDTNLLLYQSDSPYSGAGWREMMEDRYGMKPLRVTFTEVRYERLQDISEADAIAEGVTLTPCTWPHEFEPCPHCLDTGYDPPAQKVFAQLWDSINTRKGTRWADNPWVWASTFYPNNRGEQ